MELNTSNLIFLELKKTIKDRGLTYNQIAGSLGLSESGFKKIMSSSDCSLKRLEGICSAIGIRMVDLIAAAESRELLDVSFEPKEEDYFSKSPEGFQVYWFLVYERRSSEETMRLMHLEPKNFFSIVRSLDKLNLLQLLPNDRILVPTPRGIRWVSKSKFILSLYKRWSLLLLERGLINLKKEDSSQNYFNIRYLKMSDATWDDFKKRLQDIEVEFSNRATAEMRLNFQTLRHVRWLTVVDNESWGEQDIKKTKSLF